MRVRCPLGAPGNSRPGRPREATRSRDWITRGGSVAQPARSRATAAFAVSGRFVVLRTLDRADEPIPPERAYSPPVGEGDPTRLLHVHSGHGYTDRPAQAMRGEPEAVPTARLGAGGVLPCADRRVIASRSARATMRSRLSQ